jgi:hypothetical protein
LLTLLGSAGDTSSFEVNLVKEEANTDSLSITVSDKFSFGNITKGQKSEEYQFYVNNTGTVAITVTPKLTNISEKIFSNLYFREQKTKTISGVSTDVPFTKIGQYSFNISKPTSGGVKSDYTYMVLDLTNYNENVSSDIIGHKADIKFYVSAQ